MIRMLKVLAVTSVLLGSSAGLALASSSPTVTTGATSSIADTSAALNGTVNPNGAATTYQFQWGLTAAYGLVTPIGSLAAGTSSRAVKATISGLLPGTTYHYRLDAVNKSGTVVGADRTFRTAGASPPGAATGPLAAIGPFSATVTGTITPQGATTTWYVQYGLTSAYSAQTFGGTVAPGDAPVTVSEPLSGLQPGVIFHYRFVAVHGGSVPQYGADETFQTQPWPAPVPRVIASTTPHSARHSPFAFSTFGRIVGPASDPASEVCFGSADVSFYLGRTLESSQSTTIQPNCTFFAMRTFARVPGRHHHARGVKLRVVIRFDGNGWLAPAKARAETVTLK